METITRLATSTPEQVSHSSQLLLSCSTIFTSGALVLRSGFAGLGEYGYVDLFDRAIGRRMREVLEVPADYKIGIVPASDTGAVEMALWSLLGARPVEMLAWESFGEGWVTDVVKQLKLDATVRIDGPQIVLTIEDAGLPFDPVQAPEVPLATSLEQAQVGGLGIRFIRAAASHITHERVADKNRTTVWLNR